MTRSEDDGGNVLIPAGITFQGSLGFLGTGRISGFLHGSVFAQGRLEVSEGGAVEGDIEVDTLQVAGEISGDVLVRDSLRVLASGRIKGRIRTVLLSIEDGGTIEGSCSIQPREMESSLSLDLAG